MTNDFQVSGTNGNALFTLKLHRGDGMTLVAMNWKNGKPPVNFVGFAIEYKEPGGEKFFPLKNRLTFAGSDQDDPNRFFTLRAPIQKFRWVHFPRNAELMGNFDYRVTPVFMNDVDELSYGEPQTASIVLQRETFPGQLNVTFTRGFVASQAFVDFYEKEGKISTLLPAKSVDGLTFRPTHPKAKEALTWMGFEARHAILEVLDKAIKDKKAQVRVIAYDLSEPDVVSRLVKIGKRVKVIIDNSKDHGEKESGESQAERKLVRSAGRANVKRQHMGNLQHNKTIVVSGPKTKLAVCGSTNFTWRGFFVQSNNALILNGSKAIQPFIDAFDDYWDNETVKTFSKTRSAKWISLGFKGINAKVAFSPHAGDNQLLKVVADDIRQTRSSLLYSLAFLHQTPGLMLEAIKKVSTTKSKFVYGISDKRVGGIDLQQPDGNVSPVFPSNLVPKKTPEPFRSEPTGGGGNRMHHKFLVVDFDLPTARVYLGSYNFSNPADTKNGENLLLIKDRRIAVSYMIEAIRIFDHYHFRVVQNNAKKVRKKLELKKPPRKRGEEPWWTSSFENARKIRDREIFA